jgi:hypothetical protein
MNMLLVTSPSIYATVRADSGNWTVPWAAVLAGTSPTVLTNPPEIHQVACATVKPSDVTYVVARLGHPGPIAFTLRKADTKWTVLEDPSATAGRLDDIVDICCGATGNDTIQLVASTASTGLFSHTMRTGSGAWTKWTKWEEGLRAKTGPIGATVEWRIAATGVGNDLHLLMQVTYSGERMSIEHTIRSADGTWQLWIEIPAPDFFHNLGDGDIACAGMGSDLYVFLRHRKTYYTVRNANGQWTPWTEMALGAPGTGFTGPLAVSADGNVMHVFAGGYYAICQGGTWSAWKDIRTIVSDYSWRSAGMAPVSRVL